MVAEAIAAYKVKVSGSPLSTEAEGKLSFIRVEESLSLPSSFTLRFTDPEFTLLDGTTFAIGTEVEISFGWGTSLTTVMRGEITGVNVEASDFAGYQLEVFGLDKMHRTMRGTKTRTFQNQSDSDVATKIAQEAGLQADVESTGGPHPFLFQVNETDHQFLRKRARRIGFDFWVSDGKLHFKRAAKASPTTVTWGEDLYRFKARMSAAGYANAVNVRGWDDATQQAVVGNGTANPNDPSDATFYTGALTASNTKFGAKTITASGVPVNDQSDATNAAKAIRQRQSAQGLLVRGEVDGDPALGAGSTIKVAGLGTKLSGQYLVTASEHVLGAGQPYVTRWISSGPEPSGLADLMASAVDATGQIRPGLHIAVGTVTNNNDPDSAGRVKVKLPELDGDSETGWVRVATPGAGKERGFQMLPAVNDEVLVAFEYGDASRPYVLGGLWSKKNKPPEGAFHKSGAVEKQMWRSGKGHEISISDAGDGELVMKLKSGDSSITVTKDLVTVKGKTKVKVEADQIEVAAKSKLTLKGRQVEVNGSQDVTIKGGMIKLN
ncbi:MAG: type IV secretion protein Rhs [Chloroflexota bacterium]